VLQGNGADDRFFLQAAINSMLIEGGEGADRYYISNNAAKALFSTQGFYDDDGLDPFDVLLGTLTDIRAGLTIDTGAGGNGGTRDVVYADSSGSGTSVNGQLDYENGNQTNTLTGLGMAAGIDVVIPDGESAFLEVGLSAAADTFRVKGVGARLVAEVFGRGGDDTLNVYDDDNSLAGISGVVSFEGGVGNDTLNVRGNATAPPDDRHQRDRIGDGRQCSAKHAQSLWRGLRYEPRWRLSWRRLFRDPHHNQRR
jgi:hypothetical protein